ncbi:hypothetical protein D3C84_1309030 [compost metagenome]
MARLDQPVFLHIQLADAVAAVHVDEPGQGVADHLLLLHRHAAGHGVGAAQEVAANGLEQDRGV